MNDYLFALILSTYIIGGVFIVLWMDRNYFDPKYCSEASGKWDVWHTLFWPFILLFVWPSNWNDWLYVPKGCREAFEKAEPWCGFETIKEFA